MAVASPCIGFCRMDIRNERCEGCLRTRDEIAAWSSMSDTQKTHLLEALAQRLAGSESFD